MRALRLLALAACGHRTEPPRDAPPPPPHDAQIVVAPAPPPLVTDRVACDQPGRIELDHEVLKCRELPFDLQLLEDGFVRTDDTTITTFAKPFTDGTIWRLELQPMLEDVSEQQLEARMIAVAKAVEPRATVETQTTIMSGNGGRAHIFGFAGGARDVDVMGWFYGGYLLTSLVAAPPGAATSARKLRGHNMLESVAPKGPATTAMVPLALAGGHVMIPARAWRYAQWKSSAALEKRSELYALPDLRATLGVRDLVATERCSELATAEPRAFIASLKLGNIATVARVTNGLRVTTADDRPAAYYLLCRDGMLVQIIVRGVTMTTPLLELLDRVADSLGA